MSLRKGDNKKQGQKYQNRTAFKITFDTQALEVHQRVYMDNLCQKCIDVLKWKMQYNKYKKATSERRCVKCEQKNVYKSYRHVCDKCAKAHKLCAKCLQSNIPLSSNPKEEQLNEERIQKEMEDYLTKLRERTRRTLVRKIQKNLVQWDDEKKHFFEIESGVQLDNLKFKLGEEIEEDLNDSDDDENDDFGDDDFEVREEKQKQPDNAVEGEIPVQPNANDKKDSDNDDDEDSDDDEEF